MKEKILLPLDCSEASLKAFIPAKSIAELLDMTLCILYISEEESSKEELLRKLNISAEDLKYFIISHKTGLPEDLIVEEGENCKYIVMGTHGETCDESKRLGSITAAVVENTSKPVLLIKPNACLTVENGKWIPHKTLIPINGTTGSAEALYPVMEIVSKITSQIDILHIYSNETGQNVNKEAFSVPYYEDYPQHEWGSWSKEFLKRFCPTMKNHIKMSVSLSQGNPADEILNFAEKNNNDFIAIVWHGTLSHLRAKTLKKLLVKCDCPLMLIKLS